MNEQVLVYDGFQVCPYLPGRVARLPLYRQVTRLNGPEADERFARAERRVGRTLYAPTCPSCTECKGIRVVVDAFEPSRSQRRVARRWAALGERARIELDHVTVTPEKLAMFNRHKRERGLQEADDEPMTRAGYLGWLAHSCFETREMRYFLDERLVAVGIIDLGKTAISSVYFYFEPSREVSRLSPGVFSVLQEVALCRQTGRTHHYLGLWVRECARLSYKASYHPHERLEGGVWRRYDGP